MRDAADNHEDDGQAAKHISTEDAGSAAAEVSRNQTGRVALLSAASVHAAGDGAECGWSACGTPRANGDGKTPARVARTGADETRAARTANHRDPEEYFGIRYIAGVV